MNPIDRFRLDDKVVLITGASSGLGLGFAHAIWSRSGVLAGAVRRWVGPRTERRGSVGPGRGHPALLVPSGLLGPATGMPSPSGSVSAVNPLVISAV